MTVPDPPANVTPPDFKAWADAVTDDTNAKETPAGAQAKADAALDAANAYTDTAVDNATSGVAASPFGRLRDALDRGEDSVAVLVMGDSTGNATDEWVYEAFATFGADYPAYTVLHRLWDDTDQAFGFPTVLQDGTAGDAYVTLDGSTQYLTSSSPNTPTGDTKVIAKIAAADYTPAANGVIGSSFGGAGDRGWRLELQVDGTLNWSWSPDGTANNQAFSTASIAAADGEEVWVRVEHDVDNGAAGNSVRFYTAPDVDGNPGSWTQLGSTVTTAGTTSIYNSTVALMIGARGASPVIFFDGKVHYFEIQDGIDGPAIAAFDASLWSHGTKLVDSTGATWTLQQGATITGAHALTVLNASTSGKALVYSNDATRFAKQTPFAPQLAFVSYGYNEVPGPTGTVAADYVTLIDSLVAKHPQATVVPVAQGPRTAPSNATQIGFQRHLMTAVIPGIAASRSLPLVDAYTALIADTATYIDADGVHPTPAGSDEWRDVALALLRTA